MTWDGPGAAEVPRYTCPLCKRAVLVNKDGTLRVHTSKPGRRGPHCTGSRRKVPA